MAPDRNAQTVVFKTLEEASVSSIKNAIEKETCDGSLVVLQELRPHEYLVEFKEKNQAECLTETGFDLATTHVVCHSPKGYYTNVSLMGLRAYIEDEEITSVLERYGEIKGPIVRLKYKSGHELCGLENGNRLVKMVLNQPSIPYSLKIDGEWCRVIHSGQQPYCSTCGEFGHNRRNCKETECHKCNEKGHIAIDCNNDAKPEDGDGEEKEFDPQADQQDNNNVQNDGSQTQKTSDEPQDQTPHDATQNMDTTENEHENKQSLKRPHGTSTDTNTDSDDGFQTVTNRRNKYKPTPKIPTTSRNSTEKNRSSLRQIKPPNIINKRNIHSDK